MNDEADQAELLALHVVLVAGDDPTAPARLAWLLLPALQRRFRRTRMPDPHAVDSMIGLGIARYLSQPESYDAARGPLLAYLWQDIQGDLRNELDSLGRRRRHETPDSAVVELGEASRNLDLEDEVLDRIDPFDVPSMVLEVARQELTQFGDIDRRLLTLLGEGVRSTAAYAEVLGLSHLPTEVQRRTVKRHKDRLKARLEAIRGKLPRPE